jgi:hypothetical protein
MQMDVLTNKDPLKSVSIIDQFTMRFNDYDISECRMVLLPSNYWQNEMFTFCNLMDAFLQF